MAEKLIVDHFCFESKDNYDRAVKEEKAIRSMRGKYKIEDEKIALKLYGKAVEEKVFSTAVGYSFLEELRGTIVKSGKIPGNKLPPIPVAKTGAEMSREQLVQKSSGEKGGRYKRLYEGQCLINKRLKLLFAALFIIVAAFVIIDLKSEYSIFTYFTDYKANMEEELIDKYEGWESELRAREEALKKENLPEQSEEQ